jgi:hypothetical protein
MFFISDNIMPGKKMANNFIKKGKKLKYQENFFPLEAANAKRNCFGFNDQKISVKCFLVFIRLDNSRSICQIH